MDNTYYQNLVEEINYLLKNEKDLKFYLLAAVSKLKSNVPSEHVAPINEMLNTIDLVMDSYDKSSRRIIYKVAHESLVSNGRSVIWYIENRLMKKSL